MVVSRIYHDIVVIDDVLGMIPMIEGLPIIPTNKKSECVAWEIILEML